MFLHADSLHSTERIKWRLEFFTDWEIIWPIVRKRLSVVTEFAHCTLSWMISYLLLLNEHKETLDFGFKVSVTQLTVYHYHTPRVLFSHLFSCDSQKTNSVTHLALGFYIYKEKKTHYFEYDACWTRCLNQIYENTNLHLLSVWRGSPHRNKGLGFPKLEVQKWKENLT